MAFEMEIRCGDQEGLLKHRGRVDHDGHAKSLCDDEDADDSTVNAPIQSWKRVQQEPLVGFWTF